MLAGEWIYYWEVWTVAGLAALIADMGLGLAYMLLPFGFAAFFVAINLAFGLTFGFMDLADWKTLVVLYGVYALICVLAIRPIVAQLKDDQPDINDY